MKPKNVVVEVLKAGSVMEESLSMSLKPYRLTLQQFNLLRILRGQKGKAANLKTVQQRMIHRMSNITRLVDKLIAKNLVCRTTCKNNRREIELFISEKGMKVLHELDPIIEDAESHLIESLTPSEQKTFYTSLKKITNEKYFFN